MARASQEPGRGGLSAPVLIGLLAAFLLGALSAAAFLAARRTPPARAAAPAPLPAPALAPPAAVISSQSARTPGSRRRKRRAADAGQQDGPLTVSLTANNDGRHVKVGAGVTFTAFTTLAPGRSATLTIFYRLNRGRKTVFSFAQGTLCSTTWMAPAPGRYEFTASALGDRRDAVSRDVEIIVDAPQVPPPPRVAAAPVPKAAPIVKPTVKRPVVVRPPVFHVAAAHFARARSAQALAGALRRNGYPAAAVRRMNDAQGKAIYVVETGTFRQPGEVYAAVAALLRSGYPAYFYAGH